MNRGRRSKSSSSKRRTQIPSLNPAAAAGALVGRRLRDRLDMQLLDLAADAVAPHAGQPAVDDIADPRHGQRSLGDVGGQHDAQRRPGMRTHAAGRRWTAARTAGSLRRRRAGGRPRPALPARRAGAAGRTGGGPAQVIGAVADLAFARQEHQHVAGGPPTRTRRWPPRSPKAGRSRRRRRARRRWNAPGGRERASAAGRSPSWNGR